jgi:hypothetical protein
MLTKIYTGLWSKYRPAILKMMLDADVEPQTYKLSNHEFVAFNNGKKGVFAFDFEVSNGKVISGLKGSSIAQDLWEILQMSRKASELVSTATYRFSMDRHFVLQVQKNKES